jgi:PAS domain-containing protein
MIEKQQEPIPPQFMPGMIENLSSPLEHISQYAPGMIYQYRLYPDGRSCFPYCSDAIKDIWGFSPKDVMNDASICFSIVHPDDLEGLLKSIDESAKTLKDWQHEYRVIIPGKDERWLLGHSKPEKCEDGSILWSGFITDVSPRVKFEKKLIKSSRLYAVTAQINQMVIHSKNQDEVFYEACRIVMVEGKFLMAWIGLFDPDFEHLKPVTLYGFLLEMIFRKVMARQDLPLERERPLSVTIWTRILLINFGELRHSREGMLQALLFPFFLKEKLLELLISILLQKIFLMNLK